jgi:hypothetical protein
MPQQPFDKSSKYLVQQHARGILRLGGVTAVRSVKAVQAELVHPRQLPDGLLEVHLEGQKKADHVLVEVATYPEKRARAQALDDLTLARQHLKGELPELLMLVLCPRGRFRITGDHRVASRLGWSEVGCKWKVVELWTLPAEELLAAPDVGVVPWVPLARYDGAPAELLERCRERIERQAGQADRANLLAVAQVLAQLKFPQPEMLALLGGRQVMIESPLLQQLKVEWWQEAILDILKSRFDAVPNDVRRLLKETSNEKKLKRLHGVAVQCASMEEFREHLLK